MFSTVPAQIEVPLSPVFSTFSSTPNHTSNSEATNDETRPQGNYPVADAPRLLMKLKSAILRLAFLKRFRTLKRPPPSIF